MMLVCENANGTMLVCENANEMMLVCEQTNERMAVAFICSCQRVHKRKDCTLFLCVITQFRGRSSGMAEAYSDCFLMLRMRGRSSC